MKSGATPNDRSDITRMAADGLSVSEISKLLQLPESVTKSFMPRKTRKKKAKTNGTNQRSINL